MDGWYTQKPSQEEYHAFQGRVCDLRAEAEGFDDSAEVAYWKQMLESLRLQAEYSRPLPTGRRSAEKRRCGTSTSGPRCA